MNHKIDIALKWRSDCRKWRIETSSHDCTKW